MEDNSLESFFGLDNQEKNIAKIQKLENTRHLMKKLCQSLASEPDKFRLEETMSFIIDFIGDKEEYLERFLYSELSMQLFEFDAERKSNFFSNIDVLLEKFTTVIGENTKDEDIKSIEKMIIKIYDHTYLVENQIGMVDRSIKSATDSVRSDNQNELTNIRENNQKELKGIQKDYIAVLSIFSAVVLAFSGGLTFSSSVLENISDTSTYKLIIIALIIGLVLINLFFGLFYYINKIIDREDSLTPLKLSNAIFLILILIFGCAGFFGEVDDQDSEGTPQKYVGNVELNYNEAN